MLDNPSRAPWSRPPLARAVPLSPSSLQVLVPSAWRWGVGGPPCMLGTPFLCCKNVSPAPGPSVSLWSGGQPFSPRSWPPGLCLGAPPRREQPPPGKRSLPPSNAALGTPCSQIHHHRAICIWLRTAQTQAIASVTKCRQDLPDWREQSRVPMDVVGAVTGHDLLGRMLRF